MGRKALLAVVCWLTVYEALGEAAKTVNSSIADNVSAESAPRLYRNIPVGVYASGVPYAAHSFHAPSIITAPIGLPPIKTSVIQDTNGFLNSLKDSYGKYVETPMTAPYKTAFPQEFVKLQELPAHLSQPLIAAAPSYQYKQTVPHFFFGSQQYKIPTLHQAATPTPITRFGSHSQPLIYADNIRNFAAPSGLYSNLHKFPTVQQQATNSRVIHANPQAYKQLQQKPQTHDPKQGHGQALHSHAESAQIVAAPAQTSVTAIVNGKKTVITLDTHPPVPQLDLNLLEPLTFANPLVPQVQHFLPRISSATYHKLPHLNLLNDGQKRQKEVIVQNTKLYDSGIIVGKPKVTVLKKKKQNKPPKLPVKPVVTVSSSPNEGPEFSYEINAPNYKETYNEQVVSYNKETKMKPVHYSYNEKHEKDPVTYSFVHSSKEPLKVKHVEYESDPDDPKQLIYKFTPEEQDEEQNEEIKRPPPQEAEDSGESSAESDEDGPILQPQRVEHHGGNENSQKHQSPNHHTEHKEYQKETPRYSQHSAHDEHHEVPKNSQHDGHHHHHDEVPIHSRLHGDQRQEPPRHSQHHHINHHEPPPSHAHHHIDHYEEHPRHSQHHSDHHDAPLRHTHHHEGPPRHSQNHGGHNEGIRHSKQHDDLQEAPPRHSKQHNDHQDELPRHSKHSGEHHEGPPRYSQRHSDDDESPRPSKHSGDYHDGPPKPYKHHDDHHEETPPHSHNHDGPARPQSYAEHRTRQEAPRHHHPEHKEEQYHIRPNQEIRYEVLHENPPQVYSKPLAVTVQNDFQPITPEYEEDIRLLPPSLPNAPIKVDPNQHVQLGPLTTHDGIHSLSAPQKLSGEQEELLDHPPSRPHGSSAPHILEKSKHVIIKEEEETPDEMRVHAEQLMHKMIQQEENSEEDFEKAYKESAFGFPAYERVVDVEKDIYNPEAYGEPRYQKEYDAEDTPFEQYQVDGDQYPKSARLTYKNSRDKTKDDYYAEYSAHKPESFSDRYKKKDDYFKAYMKNRPEKLFEDEKHEKRKEKQTEKYVAAPSYVFHTPANPKHKQYFAQYKAAPKYEYDYSKGTPRDSRGYASHSLPHRRDKTHFVEPQFQYGFEPIAAPLVLDSELAAMATNNSPESEKPGMRKKIYKENWYIKKTSTTAGKPS